MMKKLLMIPIKFSLQKQRGVKTNVLKIFSSNNFLKLFLKNEKELLAGTLDRNVAKLSARNRYIECCSPLLNREPSFDLSNTRTSCVRVYKYSRYRRNCSS